MASTHGRQRRPRPNRRLVPGLGDGRAGLKALALEDRVAPVMVSSQFILKATPQVLPPSDGKFVPVTVTGAIASTRPVLAEAFFHVTDQYRRVEPFGTLPVGLVGRHGSFYLYGVRFTVSLNTKASSNTTTGGRVYNILVGGRDADTADGRTISVFIPGNGVPPPARTPTAARRPRGG